MNVTELDYVAAWLAVMVIVCALCALGAAIEWAGRRLSAWRLRRLLLRRLPAPDDPRLRNVISLRDWKNRETAYKRFRSAA